MRGLQHPRCKKYILIIRKLHRFYKKVRKTRKVVKFKAGAELAAKV